MYCGNSRRAARLRRRPSCRTSWWLRVQKTTFEEARNRAMGIRQVIAPGRPRSQSPIRQSFVRRRLAQYLRISSFLMRWIYFAARWRLDTQEKFKRELVRLCDRQDNDTNWRTPKSTDQSVGQTARCARLARKISR